jgi:hypothetical protein
LAARMRRYQADLKVRSQADLKVRRQADLKVGLYC